MKIMIKNQRVEKHIVKSSNYNKARRVNRGLFVAENKVEINADLNGAYQIIKKVFPIKWDRGCALHPFVVNIA